MPWEHLCPILGHGMGADFDCTARDVAAGFAAVGDFDGDGREEIAVRPLASSRVVGSGEWPAPDWDPPHGPGDTRENDLWVMTFDPAAGRFRHLSPMPNHPLDADIDLSALVAARSASVGSMMRADFVGSAATVRRDQLVVALPAPPGLWGVYYYVLDLDLETRRWRHRWTIRHDAHTPAGFARRPLMAAADIDGDGRDEFIIGGMALGSVGNDFQVLKCVGDPATAPTCWDWLGRVDCSASGYPAKFVVAGDFDGDGRAELAVAADAPGSMGNDFWVMDYDPGARADPVSRGWRHLGLTDSGFWADFDCSSSNFAARFAVVGDFDGDGRDEIAVAPQAAGSAGNDFWVMDYDPAARADTLTRGWRHLGLTTTGFWADFDCSGLDYPAHFAVAGDFDGDGRDEIAVAAFAPGSKGNDFWVMRYR